MPGEPLKRLRGIAFRLKHLLKRDLMRRVIEGQGLQPTTPISHRPRLRALIDPPVAQHEGRDELPLVTLILRGAFPDSGQIAYRLMRLVGDPDRRQLSGTQQARKTYGVKSIRLDPLPPGRTGIKDGATTQQS